jgi:hypothetical protein
MIVAAMIVAIVIVAIVIMRCGLFGTCGIVACLAATEQTNGQQHNQGKTNPVAEQSQHQNNLPGQLREHVCDECLNVPTT